MRPLQLPGRSATAAPTALGTWRDCLLLALVYVAAGKLGTLLAVPPGYATLIWPPAGIAVGTLILFGVRLWPGIAAGALALQILDGPLGMTALEAPDTVKLLIGAAVATGATLHAIVGKKLVQRSFGLPPDLHRISDFLKLFLLAGPLAAVVSATIGTMALYLGGSLGEDLLLPNWMVWWASDVLGVFVFLPLSLALPMGRRRLAWKGREIGALPMASILILLLPLGLTFYAWKATSQYIYDKSLSQFAAITEENEAALRHRLDSYEAALIGAAGFLRSSEEVLPEEWRSFVRSLDLPRNFPGIKAVGFIANVGGGSEPAGGALRLQSPDSPAVPQVAEPPEYIVRLFEPLDANTDALGRNIALEEHRLAAARIARDTGASAMTKRILLGPEEAPRPGFLLLRPVYERGLPTGTVEERRTALRGWVYATFIGPDSLRGLTPSQGTLLDLSIYDGDRATPGSLIFASGGRDRTEPRIEWFSVRKTVAVMQQPWSLVWRSTSRFEANSLSYEPWLILVGGLLFSGLFGCLLSFFASRADTVSELVALQTKELLASERQMGLLVRHTPAAVAMFDRDLRLIMASERWSTTFGAGRDVEGESLPNAVPEAIQALDWLAMCGRALDGETFQDEETLWVHTDGRRDWVNWAIHPWRNAAGEIGGIVAFTEIITSRKRAELRTEIAKEIALQVLEAPSTRDILEDALDKIAGYLGWSAIRTRICEVEQGAVIDEGEWHCFPRIVEQEPDPDAIRGPLDDPLLRRRLLSDRSVVFAPNLTLWSETGQAAGVEPKVRAGLAIPIFVNTAPVAILEIVSSDPAELCHDDIEFLELLSVQMSRAAERRTYEAAIARTNRLNNAVLNSADYMVIATDHAGNVLVFNKAAEEKSGFAAREIIGRQTLELWHDTGEIAERAQMLSDELGVPVEPGIDVFTKKAEMTGYDSSEWTFIRRNGSRFPVKVTVTPLCDENNRIVGYLSILEDITDRKRQEGALRTSEEMFRSAMDYAPTGMALLGLDGRWLKVNPALCDLLGYTAEEFDQMDFQSVTHPDDLDETIAVRQRLADGSLVAEQLEKRYIHKSGRVIWVLTNVSLAANADGSPRCYIAQIQDVTERHEMERIKSEFVSVVSHELRTPLTSIRGSLGLLAGTMTARLPMPANQLIEIAYKNCERLILLVNDILDMDKIATGNMRFDLRDENLQDVVQHAVEANRDFATRYGVGLRLADQHGHAVVHVDAARLTQVVTNLLSNAVRFSPSDGEVHVTIVPHQDAWRICVTDHGDGIAPEFRARIFERFCQADSSVAREKGGTGLGLYISKQITEQMGGRIGFDTALGEGTTFWIDLPAVQGKAEPIGEPQRLAG